MGRCWTPRESSSNSFSPSESCQRFSGFFRSREGLAEFQRGLKSCFRSSRVPVLVLRHPIMVLDRWFLRQFFDGFLQEVHGQKIGVLLVVDPPEGVGDVRIVRLLLTCGLGIG